MITKRYLRTLYEYCIPIVITVAIVYLNVVSEPYNCHLLEIGDTAETQENEFIDILERAKWGNFETVIAGTATQPYQYRILKAMLVDTGMRLGFSFGQTWLLLTVMAGAVFFTLLYRYLKEKSSLVGAVVGSLYFGAMVVFFSLTGELLEMLLTYTVYLVVLWLTERQGITSPLRLGAVTIALCLGVLNRESTVALFAGFALVLGFEHHVVDDDLRIRLANIPGFLFQVVPVAVFVVGAFLLPRWIYSNAAPYPLNLQRHDLFGTFSIPANIYANLTDPQILFNMVIIFFLPMPFIQYAWSKTSTENRFLLIGVMIVLLPAYFILGLLEEARLFSEIALLITPAFSQGVVTVVETQILSTNGIG